MYALFTYDCVAKHSSNIILKFADDITIVGLISDADEMSYKEEVRAKDTWCSDNNLSHSQWLQNSLVRQLFH